MLTRRPILRRLMVALAVLAIVGLADHVRAEATIILVNLDDPSEGFNDPTPVALVGGNPGTTLGEQRRIAFRHAADIWGAQLDSDVEIEVAASFDALDCDANSAVLGQAGPSRVDWGFLGAVEAGTWYPSALANRLAGSDLSGFADDIVMMFNSSIGTTCSFPDPWYYGLDANALASELDFVTVVLHELAHGLGFVTLVSGTGEKFQGKNDVYMLHLEDHSEGLLWPEMTAAERVASSIDPGDLHWIGQSVIEGSSVLSDGLDPNSGHVEMYAPPSLLEPGRVVHFNTDLTPNQLLEPFLVESIHDLGLALDVLLDIGWGFTPVAYWRMNETSGDLVLDETGVHDGTAFGTEIVPGPGCWGFPGNARIFGEGSPESPGHVLVADHPDWDLGSEFTIQAWIYPMDPNGEQYIFSHYDPQGNNRSIAFLTHGRALKLIVNADGTSAGDFSLEVLDEFAPNVPPLDVPTAIRPREWQYVVASFNAGRFRLYNDGILLNETTLPVSSVYPASAPVVIGARPGEGGVTDEFHGFLDDVRIVDREFVDTRQAQQRHETFRCGVTGPQSRDQMKCINALNKSLAKVAKKRSREILKCVKAGGADKLEGTIEGCILDDARGKVAKAKGKTISDEIKKCVGDPPNYAAIGASTVNDVAVRKPLDLIHDVIGTDLDIGIVKSTLDKDAFKCQIGVAQKVSKCMVRSLREFNRCKKSGLKGTGLNVPPGADLRFDDPGDVEKCVGHDPRGKIAKACDPVSGKIRAIIDKKCVAKGVNLSGSFVGCSTDDSAQLTQCLSAISNCRVCQMLNSADGLVRDCDLFDDGQANESCSMAP